MTSNATPCLAGSPATSNTITMKVGVLSAGVVAYWHLDEVTGNNYVDANGLNDGTGNLSANCCCRTGKWRPAFDGTTTKIEYLPVLPLILLQMVIFQLSYGIREQFLLPLPELL